MKTLELEKRIQKHDEKIKAHMESKSILQKEKEELLKKIESVDAKILSTEKNLEYHTGKKKAYEKVLTILDSDK